MRHRTYHADTFGPFFGVVQGGRRFERGGDPLAGVRVGFRPSGAGRRAAADPRPPTPAPGIAAALVWLRWHCEPAPRAVVQSTCSRFAALATAWAARSGLRVTVTPEHVEQAATRLGFGLVHAGGRVLLAARGRL